MIYEDVLFQSITVEESKARDSLGKVKFLFAKGDVKTGNRRTYKTEFLVRETRRLQGLIDSDSQVWGAPEHPEGSAHLRVGQISHKMSKFWMKGNEAWGEAEILNTRLGADLAVVLRKGRVGASLRAEGGVHAEGGEDVVDDDARIIGVDFTLSPSVEGALTNGLYESMGFPAERKAEIEITEEEENKMLSEEFFSVRQQLEDAVRSGFDEGAWVKDFSPDLAIVRTVEYDQASGETREALVQIPYKIGDGGEVTLDLENVERVREQTVFTPVAEQGPEETRFGKLSNEEMRLSGAKENFGPETKLNLTRDEERYLSPAEAKRYRDEKFLKK